MEERVSEEMVTICFVAPAEMKQALEERAKEEDRSVSSLLRILLDPPMDAWRREQEMKAQRAALAQVGGPRTAVAGSARVFEE